METSNQGQIFFQSCKLLKSEMWFQDLSKKSKMFFSPNLMFTGKFAQELRSVLKTRCSLGHMFLWFWCESCSSVNISQSSWWFGSTVAPLCSSWCAVGSDCGCEMLIPDCVTISVPTPCCRGTPGPPPVHPLHPRAC